MVVPLDTSASGFGVITDRSSADFWVCLCWVGVLFPGFCFLEVFIECWLCATCFTCLLSWCVHGDACWYRRLGEGRPGDGLWDPQEAWPRGRELTTLRIGSGGEEIAASVCGQPTTSSGSWGSGTRCCGGHEIHRVVGVGGTVLCCSAGATLSIGFGEAAMCAFLLFLKWF